MRNCALFVVLVTALVGCSTGPSIEGKWNVTGGNMPPNAVGTATFAKPDSMSFVLTMEQQMGPEKAKITAAITGGYKFEGDKLTLNAKEAKMDIAGVNDQIKKLFDSSGEGQRKQMIEQFNSAGTAAIKWEGNDKFTVTTTQGTQTFSRAK